MKKVVQKHYGKMMNKKFLVLTLVMSSINTGLIKAVVTSEATFPPLFAAARGNNLEEVKALLGAGADVEVRGLNGQTPLISAAAWGHDDVFDALVAAGANIEAQCNDKFTPLLIASSHGNRSIVDKLIVARANIEAQNKGGATPLRCAVGQGHLGVVESLIAAGCDLEAACLIGHTPLTCACLMPNKENSTGYAIIDSLIGAKANVEAQEPIGKESVLAAAIMLKHTGAARKLIRAGANVHKKTTHNQTLLIVAAASGNTQIVPALIEAGIAIDKKEENPLANALIQALVAMNLPE